MATHNVGYYVRYDAEFNGYSLYLYGLGGSSGYPKTIKQGDKVIFSHSNSGAGVNVNVKVSGFSSYVWTSNTTVTTSKGQSFERTVSTTGNLGPLSISFNPTTTSAPTRYGYVNIVSGVDREPDRYTFTSLTYQPVSTLVTSELTEVTGIGSGTPISISSGGSFQINGGSWKTSSTIGGGDTLRLRRTTSSSYNTTLLTTVTIGTGTFASTNWSIKTEPSLDEGIIIPATALASAPFTLGDIASFFGYTNKRLSDYHRKGAGVPGGLIPDIPANSSIPTSGDLKLSDFVGAHTSMYWFYRPSHAGRLNGFTNGQSATLTITKTEDTDYKVGYGELGDLVSYRYTLTMTSSPGGTTPTLTSQSGSPGTYSNGNKWFRVSLTKPNGFEGTYSGYVTIYARHHEFTQHIISTKISFIMDFSSLQ